MLAVMFVVLGVATSATLAQTANKRTAVASRLKADVNVLYLTASGYSPMDSTTFAYAPPRGPWADGWEAWKYSTREFYNYNLSTNVYDALPYTRYMLTFNAANEITDRITQQWNFPTASWGNSAKDIISYSATGKIDTVITYGWDGTAGAWKTIPSYRQTYTYNASDQRTRATNENWNASASAFRNVNRYNYTWNSTGDMASSTYQTWSGTAWQNNTLEVYGWDASNNKIETVTLTWGFTWDSSLRDTHSGFHNHQPDLTVRAMYVNVVGVPPLWSDIYRWTTTFNSYDQPTYRYREHLNTVSLAWEPYDGFYSAERWYYEDYDPSAPLPTTVMLIPETNADVRLYPVPASTVLNIDMKWHNAQSFNATIFDEQGRQVIAWQQPPTSEYHDKLDVSNLPAGCYYLRITSVDGVLNRTFNVVRQAAD